MTELHLLPGRSWATIVAEELLGRLNANPSLRLCLPTGGTPAPLYAALAAGLAAGRAPIEQATIVLLDEYVGLGPDDPARCDNQLRRDLLDRLPAQPAVFHDIRVDELGAREAANAHDEVAAQGLDLAIVGLGLNGHIGFNEPGSNATSPTRVVKLHPDSVAVAQEYGAEARPGQGITLGLARLLEAAEIWLLVTGEHKAEILRRTLREPETDDVPASFLRGHARLRVFADEAAGAAL